MFEFKGAVGNIGQRDAGTIANTLFVIQEGNTGHMPPTIWQDWRLWLYLPDAASGETLPPTGQGTITELAPVTDKGSYAFGNPSFKSVPCPTTGSKDRTVADGDSDCIFVSFFAFGEGAAPGEAGVVAFYNRLVPS